MTGRGWSRLVASNSLMRLFLSVKSGIIKSGEYPQGDKMTSRKLSVEWVMPFCRPIESCLMRATRCLSLKRKRWTTGWNIITSFLITSGTLLRGTMSSWDGFWTVKRCVAELGGNLKPVGWICVRSGELAYPLILVGSSGGSLVGVISIENWVVPHHVILGQLNRGRNIFICFTKLRS